MPLIISKEITCDGTDCGKDMTGKNPAIVRIHGGLREIINIEEDKLFLCDGCVENNNFKFKFKNIAELKAEAEAAAVLKAAAEAAAEAAAAEAAAAAAVLKAEAKAAAAEAAEESAPEG